MNCEFPEFRGLRCLMMPYIQGEPESVPKTFDAYADVISSVYIKRGDLGFLTIDESAVEAGKPHRGKRAKYGRALHTEAGILRGVYGWGPTRPGWGGGRRVLLDRGVRVLIASNVAGSCAVWDAEHEDTSEDGDIGDCGAAYPYETAHVLDAGEVADIGILTPHESLPLAHSCNRQFLRIVSSGVHGREPYFTKNPLVSDQTG